MGRSTGTVTGGSRTAVVTLMVVPGYTRSRRNSPSGGWATVTGTEWDADAAVTVAARGTLVVALNLQPVGLAATVAGPPTVVDHRQAGM